MGDGYGPSGAVDGRRQTITNPRHRPGQAEHCGNTQLAGDDRGMREHTSGFGDDAAPDAQQRRPRGVRVEADQNVSTLYANEISWPSS